MPGRSWPVAFSADGKRFAAAAGNPQRRITVWETATRRQVWSVDGLGDPASALAFSHDGKYLVAAMQDTSALVWDLTQKP